MAKYHDAAFTAALIQAAFDHIKEVRAEYNRRVVALNTSQDLSADERLAQRWPLMLSADEQVRAIAEETGAQIAAYLRLESAD